LARKKIRGVRQPLTEPMIARASIPAVGPPSIECARRLLRPRRGRPRGAADLQRPSDARFDAR